MQRHLMKNRGRQYLPTTTVPRKGFALSALDRRWASALLPKGDGIKCRIGRAGLARARAICNIAGSMAMPAASRRTVREWANRHDRSASAKPDTLWIVVMWFPRVGHEVAIVH
jgi:hypothetical protein